MLQVRNVHGTTAGAHFVKSSLREDLHGRPPRLDGSEILRFCIFQEVAKKQRITTSRRVTTTTARIGTQCREWYGSTIYEENVYGVETGATPVVEPQQQ